MIWRIALLLLSFLIAAYAGVLTAKASPPRSADVRPWVATRPRTAQRILTIGLVIGIFAAAGLQNLYIGWWAFPLFFIPFWLATYVPVVLHNLSVARAATGDSPKPPADL